MKDNYGQKECTELYQIPLENLDSGQRENYIGATARNLKDRIDEHKRDIRKGILTTALVKRAYVCNVKVDWEDTKVTKHT